MRKTLFKYSKNYPIAYALLAAILFGLNAPLSKLLLADIPPLFMAAFLYLGAGIGMTLLHLCNTEKKRSSLVGKRVAMGNRNDPAGCRRSSFIDGWLEIYFCSQCIFTFQL